MDRLFIVFFAINLMLTPVMPLLAVSQGQGIAINLDPAQASQLTAAAKASGIDLVSGSPAQIDAATRLVALEAGGADLSADDLKRLGNWVQQGGSLLLTLSNDPKDVAFQLAFLSPTTGWHTEIKAASRGGSYGPVSAGEVDGEFFPEGAPKDLALPFCYQVRPWDAVERGQGRYEQFSRTIPYIKLDQKAGDSFWTRPLLNREWKIRMRGTDVGQTPLLLTGRYGAGRVAVFASSAQDINASPGVDALWKPTLKWLSESVPASQSPLSSITPEIAVDKTARTLHVTLKNPGAAPLPLQVVMRLLTWEQALAGDVLKDVVVPANGTISVVLPLPAVGPTRYQALDYRDTYEVRLGVLSSDGSTLLNETRMEADLRPDVMVDVSTDNLRTVPYPFNAPGYNGQERGFPYRFGLPVMAYAYPPGKKVNVSVTVSNGVKNIAPLARVTDETSPPNPTSDVAALIDGAVHNNLGTSMDGVGADGVWRGVAGRENVLTFTWPTAYRISGVTLNGSPDDLRKALMNNPSSVIVELDGHEVIREDKLQERFVAEGGLVHLSFPPTVAKAVRIRLPGTQAPILGELSIDGSSPDLAVPALGVLTVTLHDALSGKVTSIGKQDLTLAPGATQILPYSVDLPSGQTGPQFYRVEASFDGQTGGAPIMQIQPEHPLKPVMAIRPDNANRLGFSIASGFRTVISLDTGAHDAGGGGGRPPSDTLIWAYEHGLKQINAGARTEMGRLYASDSNTTYVSTPWRSFFNGEPFYEMAAPLLVEEMKKGANWKASDIAMLCHGDRWDTGPAVDTLHGWQDFIGFDDFLTSKGQPGLKGKTKDELTKEIHEQHESMWQEWNVERYVAAITTLQDAFKKEGKDLQIQGQGMPFVPPRFDKAPLTEVVKGQSQDCTWELSEECVPYTTGFQMAVMAYNPGWQLSTLFNWGYESAVLNNPMWHIAVGTTEPSRRGIYDRAFRGTISEDGTYQSMHTYGYNMNAGNSYTMTTNDWQESWRAQERNSLLTPDGPVGIGLIVGVAQYDDPAHVVFSGGGMGDDWGHNPAKQATLMLANVVRRLQDAGLSIPFAANAVTVAKWGKASPLVILNLDTLTDAEVAGLANLKEHGSPLAAFQGTGKLSAAAAQLFGVTVDGTPGSGHKVGDLNGKEVIAGANTLFIPMRAEELNAQNAELLAPLLKTVLQPRIQFPEGTSGYGFTSNQRTFVLVEDWREEGRTVTLRYRADGKAGELHALDVNEHRPLVVRREGGDWLIDLPLRPGDGALVCLDEITAPQK